jgi:hypothetical protein
MRIVERMTQTPPKCLHCGAGNVENTAGEVEPALDLERDVGWGDPTYICSMCVAQIAALWGYISIDQENDYKREVRRLKQELHDLTSKHAAVMRRIRKVTAGRAAAAQLKEDIEEEAKAG